MPAAQRTKQHYLTPEEKVLVVNTYHAFEVRKRVKTLTITGRLREAVAEALGFSPRTIGRVWAEWKKSGCVSRTPPPLPRGHPPRSAAEDHTEILREIINSRNKLCVPTTANVIRVALLKETGLDIPVRTLRKVLNRQNFKFTKGKERNYLADRENMVAYRKQYLEKKIVNRDRNGVPKKPEVYLDESYCNEHHSAQARWLCEDRVRYTKSGKGKRFCIVGAGVVYKKNGKRFGEWVRSSLEFWQSDLAQHEDIDYHGNFNHGIFSRWFTKLCASLADDYGGCLIYMDGAAYHKYVENKQPTASWTRGNIMVWLAEQGVQYPNGAKKMQLLALSKENKQETVYFAQRVASMHGHRVYYTPPYHPELQPIEMIWGAAKNRISRDPAKSISDLGDKISSSFQAVSSKTWLGAYKKVQKQEDLYLEN